jgi:hypothetical protein
METSGGRGLSWIRNHLRIPPGEPFAIAANYAEKLH